MRYAAAVVGVVIVGCGGKPDPTQDFVNLLDGPGLQELWQERMAELEARRPEGQFYQTWHGRQVLLTRASGRHATRHTAIFGGDVRTNAGVMCEFAEDLPPGGGWLGEVEAGTLGVQGEIDLKGFPFGLVKCRLVAVPPDG
jgi:hypothetical protein